MSDAVRVILVDEEPSFRDGLRAALHTMTNICVVADAPDAHAGLTAVDRARPDVVLMDIGMPGLGGVPATRALKLRHPEAKVLMLSGNGRSDDVLDAFEAGALGYALKTEPFECLVDGIRTVSVGRPFLSPAMQFEILGVRPGADDILVVEDDPELREDLALLLRGQGYKIASAGSGGAALEYLRRRPPPRLILLDLDMPVMGGVEFSVEKNRNSSWARIPMVVMTGRRPTDPPSVPEVRGYLPNPSRRDDLLRAIGPSALGISTPERKTA